MSFHAAHAAQTFTFTEAVTGVMRIAAMFAEPRDFAGRGGKRVVGIGGRPKGLRIIGTHSGSFALETGGAWRIKLQKI